MPGIQILVAPRLWCWDTGESILHPLPCRGNPDAICGRKIDTGDFGGDPYGLQACPSAWPSLKCQQILVSEYILDGVEIRPDAHRTLESQKEGFPSAVVRQLGHTVLSGVCFEEVALQPAHSGSIDRVYKGAGSLGNIARGIRVRDDTQATETWSAARPVYSIRYHYDGSPIWMVRPAVHQIDNGKIGTSEGARGCDGKPDHPGSLIVVGREVLQNLNRSISHVADPH